MLKLKEQAESSTVMAMYTEVSYSFHQVGPELIKRLCSLAFTGAPLLTTENLHVESAVELYSQREKKEKRVLPFYFFLLGVFSVVNQS